ncbi:MAG: protein phosphatase 2C domain-containing protein [Azoarcus sp.]|jgi:hypothetical protein|nr:protein phosphatase 2C domain-containing protein [Azoarcus sp.]
MRDARKAFLERVLEKDASADIGEFLDCCTDLFEHFEQQLCEAWRHAAVDEAASPQADVLEPPSVMQLPESESDPLDSQDGSGAEVIGGETGQSGSTDEMPPTPDHPAFPAADESQGNSLNVSTIHARNRATTTLGRGYASPKRDYPPKGGGFKPELVFDEPDECASDASPAIHGEADEASVFEAEGSPDPCREIPGLQAEVTQESSQPQKEDPDTMITPSQAPVPVMFKLHNGKQSKPYTERLAILSDAKVVIISVCFPAELELEYCPENGEITGVPKLNGDFSGTVHYRFEDDLAEAPRVGTVDVYINPDPTLLWKNLESDRNAPFWKPDEQAQLICGKERRIIAARKRGRSHAHVGSFCDDDYFVHHDSDDDWYIAIVADGAGSAKLSRLGSRIAVHVAGNHLKQVLRGDTGKNIVKEVHALQNEQDPVKQKSLQGVLHRSLYGAVGHAAHRAMKGLLDGAEKYPELISVKDLSTTLLAGIARRCGDQWLCAAYWVGDGAVGVYSANQSVQLLGEVDSGDYSGQTRFLDIEEVSPQAILKRTRFKLCDHFTGFILMTDGVSDAKFETEARMLQCDAWDELWTDLETGARLSESDGNEDKRLLQWLDFWSQGNHDDRTIVIIC